MSFLTVDMEELRKSWMKLYLNLMSLKSHDPAVSKVLNEYAMKVAEMNDSNHSSSPFSICVQPRVGHP